MNDRISEFLILLRDFGWRDAVDILLVAYLNYKILMLLRGSRAWRVVLAAGFFVLVLFLSNLAGLTTLHWILEKATLLAPVALVILLLPELRQVLEGLGRLPLKLVSPTASEPRTVEEVVAAVAEMASTRVGALIILERTDRMDEIASNGILLHAKVSSALLGSIFYEGNPLHDGAVILRGDVLLAAACRLPLSDQRVDQTVHMRHRAALGVTESFDCLAVVVSEERGTISVAQGGRLRRMAGHLELREALNREMRRDETPPRPRRAWLRNPLEAKR